MRNAQRSIGVVGGGFTGVAAAIACLERLGEPFHLFLVEPSASLGRGVAFGGHHPMHLLNVRTRDLSVRFGQPGDFLNWAFHQLDQGENHAGLHEGLAHTFLPRQLFGEYVRQRFFETVERRKDVEFHLIKASATARLADRGRFTIHFDRAAPVSADVAILATAYGLDGPSSTGALAPFGDLAGAQLAEAKSIVLMGSGLTMVDVLLNARREGFGGIATIISRRGQLPGPHAPKGVVPQEIGLPRFKRISALTAAVRIACEAAEAYGTPWQAILNGLRPSLQDIWQGLAVEEQARFLRHVRPFWDAHRHRLPLEVYGRIRAEFDAGRAVLLRGRATGVERGPDGFRLTLQRPGGDEAEVLEADLAFDCTGHKPDLGSPLIKSLLHQGLARLDAHQLGLTVRPNGEVTGRGDAATPGLYALGPLCHGSLWEITSVPEIVAQADAMARSIAVLGQARGYHNDALKVATR
jgi:uncharacterized NAD(P)/FAD-binding protein YdhS